MEQHIYTPLPQPNPTGKLTAYTRLLLLWQGEGADPFYCTLEVVDIEHPPAEFEALSYVWGREKGTNKLLCGNYHGQIHGELELTKNLEEALRSLRLPNQSRRLWIDAICINQEDLGERARQVSYMQLVYKHATRVVIWLGQKDATIRRAFSFAQEMALLVGELAANIPDSQSPEQEHESQTLCDSILVDTMKSRPDDAKALDALLSKEYFERVWCIQETTAGNNCIAKCEDLELDFFCLLVLVPIVMRYKGIRIESRLQMWQLVSQQKSRDPTASTPAASLGPMLLVLMIIRNFKSTNPVDRIFALLGCTDEGLEPVLGLLNILGGNKNNRALSFAQRATIWLADKINSVGPGIDVARHPALKPNYEKSVPDVFRDFTRYCIRRSPRILDVLSHVQHHSDPRLDDEFPTWVPKFHETRIASFFVLHPYMAGIPPMGHYRYFAVVHDNPLHPESSIGPGIVEPNILKVDGFRIDVVEAVSDTVLLTQDEAISPKAIWNQLSPVPLFSTPATPYFNGLESLDVAFLMTLLAGGAGNFAITAPTGASHLSQTTSRSEALDYITRQAKYDIHEWLQGEPDVDPSVYPELVGGFQNVIQAQGRSRFQSWSVAYTLNRKLYRTQSGRLGLGPRIMKPGDYLVVLFGGTYPFVLRPIGSEWVLIGDTYIHDDKIMRGHEVTKVRSGPEKGRTETFRIR